MNFMAGVLGSWVALSILYPIEHARNQLSTAISTKKQTILGSIRSTIKHQGFKALYTGSSISMFGVAIFRGVNFGLFDTYKGNKKGIERWWVAYLSSLAAITLTYPTDTIRRRLMCSMTTTHKYNGFLDCSYQVYRR